MSKALFHLVLVFDSQFLDSSSPVPLVAVGENPKESKPQAGTTRPQDVNRRDQQRNPGTSTTAGRPSPGGVQDTEMVRLRLVESRMGGEPWKLPSQAVPLGVESFPTCTSWEPTWGSQGWHGEARLGWFQAACSPSSQGPCRRHLDSVLQQLQTEVYRGAHTLYVPNCDHRGFYRKRQVRPLVSSLPLGPAAQVPTRDGVRGAYKGH